MTEGKDDGEFVLPLDNFPSRNSSMNRSSRLYYRRTATEGVPFQWEMQPGTPKVEINPPLTADVPPPLSPPPARLSLGLQRPGRIIPVQGKPPLFVLFGRWRKRSNSKKQSCPSDDDLLTRFGDCGSHCEFMESPCKQNSSSSSSNSTSSSSSSLTLPLPSSSLPAVESSGRWRLGCGRWRINPAKIAIGRRV